jgi:predicted transcriptional regulator
MSRELMQGIIMYMAVMDMNSTDYAVSRAIMELERDGIQRMNATVIAKKCWCGVQTAERSLRRLKKAGLVKRTGSPVHGYRYKYLGE